MPIDVSGFCYGREEVRACRSRKKQSEYLSKKRIVDLVNQVLYLLKKHVEFINTSSAGNTR